jgi:hypothetical protein
MKGGADDDLAHLLILKTIKPGLLTYFKYVFTSFNAKLLF